MKKWIVNLLKLLFVLGIFYYLISHDRMNFDTLYRLWTSPFVGFMFLVFIFWILPLASLRLWLILKTYDFNLPITKVYVLSWIGNFFNISLPGSITGDVVKGYYIVHAVEKKETTKVVVTLLIDRLIGLFALVVVSFFSLLINKNSIINNELPRPLVFMIIILFIITILFYGIILYPFKEGKDPIIGFLTILPQNESLLKIYGAFKNFQHHRRVLIYTMILSVSVHLTIAFMFLEVAGFTEKSLTIANQLFIMPIGFITTAIPLAPGGIGIGHVAFDNLYQMIGISGGADIFNLYITVQLAVFLLGGIPYLLTNNKPISLKN